MKPVNRWQRGIMTAQLCLAIGGIVMYSQVRGFSHPGEFLAFVAGMGAILLWLRYAQRRPRRQAAMLMLLLTYVLVMPVVISGKYSSLVFVGGMMLPITVVFSALYFGAFRKGGRRNKPPSGGDAVM